MRKLKFMIFVCVLLFSSSCSTNQQLLEHNVISKKDDDISVSEQVTSSTNTNIIGNQNGPNSNLLLDDVENEIIESYSYSEIEISYEIYSILHPKEQIEFFLLLQEDIIPFSMAFPNLADDPFFKGNNFSSRNRFARILNNEGIQIQTINLDQDILVGLDFEDVNNDGYIDIVANIGGTWNEAHELYIWNSENSEYEKVIFEGFEMLSFFSIYDGYIENFLRGSSPEDSIKQKLLWDGNILYLESIID